MSQVPVRELADALWKAQETRIPIENLSGRYPTMNEQDAYAIQCANAEREKSRGKKLLGYKVGLTSREAQKQFQVFQPDFGHLFEHMLVEEGGEIYLSGLIQPKIEAEIAFVMGSDLKGPGVTLSEAAAAVAYAIPALEIVDSRIANWKIKAVDTIADNGSSALFVLGRKKTPIGELDLPLVGMALSVNGDVKVTGAGAAVLGNPLNAVAFLANELGHHGLQLFAGQVVLSGALSSMLPMKAGETVLCEMSDLESAAVTIRS